MTSSAARFAEKCAARESGCIEWTAGTTANGYGVFYANGRMHTAHRWAYQQTHGALPAGIDVCHHCDNRLCVNLAHLFAGTRKDNMQDAARKGRTSRVARKKGEAHGMATITDAQASAIRDLGRTARVADVARSFSTSYMVAYRVINGKTFKHV